MQLESAYMNKLTKMSQEMEVAMRQIQNELVEADQVLFFIIYKIKTFFLN